MSKASDPMDYTCDGHGCSMGNLWKHEPKIRTFIPFYLWWM